MAKLIVFNMVSLDGYYAGLNGDISWHNTDAEFGKFADEQTKLFGTQLYGRVTYQVMESYWPTEKGRKDSPIVADLMNSTPKVVFSKTLKEAHETENWKNVTLKRMIDPAEINQLKQKSTRPLVIFGSGSIVQELTNLSLIDEYWLMVNPVILGNGKLLFQNMKKQLTLKLLKTKTFQNGNVLLYYGLAKN